MGRRDFMDQICQGWEEEGAGLALDLLRQVPTPIAVLDGEGVIRRVNRAWLRAALEHGGVGGRRELCRGVNYLEVCGRSEAGGDEMAGAVRRGLAEVLAGERASFTLEYPCASGDAERWFLLYAAPLAASGVLVAHIDVSARREEEAELARREGWQRLILGSTSDLISSHAPDGVHVFVSGACRHLLGYEPEEMLGRSVLEFVHPDDREAALAAHRALYDLRDVAGSFNLTCRLLRRDGRYIWTEANLRALGGGPEPGYFVAVTRDVSAHKEAEVQQSRLRRALERAAVEWRSTFDALETPILLLGLDGRVQKINRAARDLLGGEYREIIGRPLAETGSGPLWGAVAALAGRVLESLTPQVCEATDERRSQTWEVEAAVSATRGDEDAKVIVQVRDITKTVRLQDSLRRSETMAALGAVVGGVAHEVRNPLFGMSAVLDAFESRFGGRPEHQPYLPLLRTELRRMTELMQALLDYGKPGRFEKLPGDLRATLEMALDLVRPLAERREVALAVAEGPAGSPVPHDAGRLAQALKNVIENAVQHSPPGSEVRIAVTEETVDGEPRLRLAVRDQGPGFAAADLPRLTEPFFSRRQGGTGLGLSIVSRVVEDHGASLRLANHPEGGAVVEIELPCTPSSEG